MVSHKIQVTKAENLVMIETRDGHQPIGVDELKAPKANAAAEGRTKSESDIGARCYRCHDHKRDCVTFPYLAYQLSLF